MVRRKNGTHTLHALSARAARLPMRVRVAWIAALLSLTLGALLAVPTGQPASAASASPQVLSCNGPCVGITNPLYSSNGQLVAEGPVGAQLTVEGSNWPPSTTLTVWPSPDAATCALQQPTPPAYAGQLTVGGTGIVRGIYPWPMAANNVNQTYLLCAVDGTAITNPVVVSNGINLYTVLAADAPALTLAPTTITPGQDTPLMISGQNWLPQQPLNVTICSDSNCTTPSIASQTTASAQDGTFQITLTIKADTIPGSYFVLATSANGALKAPSQGSPAQLTVSTPTPTPTPTPSPTPTPTPNPTPPNSGKANTTLLIVLLGAVSLLFLIGGIISIAVYTRGGP